MKKAFTLFIFACFVFIPLRYSFGAVTTTGFIPGQIWYSKDSFVEGETVKIYTAIWNSSASSLSARVEFYDKNVILGYRDVTVPSSQLQEVYVSWKVTSGDHSISAKIISPSVTLSGKKEVATISNSVTETDKKFIPVVINTVEGKAATSSDIIKNQVDKAASSLTDILPDSVTEKGVGAVDNFRADTFKTISESKIATEKKIEEFKKASSSSPSKKSSSDKKSSQKVGVEDATEKPIAYLKLFFLSVLSFIFGSKIVFYIALILVIFLVVRFTYRKVARR